MESTKLCKSCQVIKKLEDFTNNRKQCDTCYIRRSSFKKRIKNRNYLRQFRASNREAYNASCRDYKTAHPQKTLLSAAKHRAKVKGMLFNIEESDIIIPELCPVLHIKLTIAKGRGANDNSPTLDRIRNDLGYVKGNVRVISFRANSLKRDGTIEEFQKILRDLQKNV